MTFRSKKGAETGTDIAVTDSVKGVTGTFTGVVKADSINSTKGITTTGRLVGTDLEVTDSAISNTVITKQLTIKAPFIPVNSTVTRERIKITDSLTSSTEFKLTDIKTTMHKDLSGNYEWGDWIVEQYDVVKGQMDTTLAYEWDNDTREKFRFYSPVYFDKKIVASNEVFLDSTTHADSLLVRDITYTDTYWDDYPVSVLSGKVSAVNAPTWEAFGDSASSYSFDVNDYIDLETVDMSHGWKLGTSIHPHIHWATKIAVKPSASVKWTLKYIIGGDNVIYKSGSISVEDTVPTDTPLLTSQFAAFPEITMTGIPMEWVMKLRLYRGTAINTDITGRVFAGVVGIHYEKDSPGSRTISTK